ncbi:AAA family ATPase [Pseudomonas aeruginosa]|uniref:AAA family ATPase n=1 Tax=Pseudomonas aeruginosa TaxID=287 RepID=UPI0009AA9ECC|nr:ATP-binding protein [Pseudomonas aeruginosa]
MIKDFEIEKFRHFDKLTLENLSRVNLFVGKNSAGKSALLEALLLFFSQMSQKYIYLIHQAREEWDGRSISLEQNPMRHLFYGHKLPKFGEDGLSLSSKKDKRSFKLKIAPYIKERDPERMIITYVPLSKEDVRAMDESLYENFVILEKGSEIIRLISSDSDMREMERRMRISKNKFPQENCLFVPTYGLDEEEIASLWDSISLTELEDAVIRGLRLIEPKVEAIAFVGGDRRSRVPLVKLKGQIEPMPLRSLGDGMRKIFQIVLSLANSRDGVLLVDEFENGLHWSVQEEAWKLVFELSRALNVQVFATTHSRDCVNGFESAWSTDTDSGSFRRIAKDGEKVHCKEYKLELLKDSLETDVEVR